LLVHEYKVIPLQTPFVLAAGGDKQRERIAIDDDAVVAAGADAPASLPEHLPDFAQRIHLRHQWHEGRVKSAGRRRGGVQGSRPIDISRRNGKKKILPHAERMATSRILARYLDFRHSECSFLPGFTPLFRRRSKSCAGKPGVKA